MDKGIKKEKSVTWNDP